MPRLPSRLRPRIRSMSSYYGLLLGILVQMGCSLVGCLAIHGSAEPIPGFYLVPMAGLMVAFFALAAIWSRRQELCRSYAVLLAVLIVLDLVWLRLYAQAIWTTEPGNDCRFLVYSLRLALLMQVIGFSVRVLSFLSWIQICILGSSSVYNRTSSEANSEERDSRLDPTNQDTASYMLNPTYEVTRKNSNSDETSGVAIFDPSYGSYRPEKPQGKGLAYQDEIQIICHVGGSASTTRTSQRFSDTRNLVPICDLVEMQRMQNAHD